MAARVDHVPKGDPCPCGYPFEWHRVEHAFVPQKDEDDYSIDECRECSLPRRNHRGRSTYRAPAAPRKRSSREPREPKAKKPRQRWPDEPKKVFMGIDGEGCGRDPHRYVMLCTRDELGHRQDSVENPKGLSTEECFELMLRQPTKCKLFAFAFGYDLTKILQDIPPAKLWVLAHPETRMSGAKKFNKPLPVMWRAPSGVLYRLNLLASRFTVERGKRKCVVWDVFRFYGTSFVRALTDWDVGTPEERAEILKMKEQRGEDDWMRDPKSVAAARVYCMNECRFLAQLVRKLVEASESAGLELTQFYGAGSLADAMMKTISIKEQIVKEPREMQEPIMSAFFGGRFENSVVGEVPGPLYNSDIASAYPYQTAFLPCLRHSKWTRSKDRKRIDTAAAALIRYRLGPAPKDLSWGPLPFRESDGTIVYPSECGGGWVWREEYYAAEAAFPHVEFVEAYILRTECDCRPFARVPTWYRLRLQIGKEGAGLIYKNGPNSIYGKLAQSIGASPPYQCWTWAGLITSGTRAQLLGLMARHRSMADVLSVATDGIISRERVELPVPKDTGTFDCEKSAKEISKTLHVPCKTCGEVGCRLAHKALGSWERKVTDAGVFFARPGIYFDLEGVSDATVRARGLGRRTLLEYVGELRKAWRDGKQGLRVAGDKHPRFQGMRSCVRRRPSDGLYLKSDAYGEWRPMPVDMSFDPAPKRDEMVPCGPFSTLTLRKLPRELVSDPYAGKVSPERAMYLEAARIAAEQPDVEEYEERDEE